MPIQLQRTNFCSCLSAAFSIPNPLILFSSPSALASVGHGMPCPYRRWVKPKLPPRFARTHDTFPGSQRGEIIGGLTPDDVRRIFSLLNVLYGFEQEPAER